MSPKVKEKALLLLLGGSGTRFDSTLPKQFLSLPFTPQDNDKNNDRHTAKNQEEKKQKNNIQRKYPLFVHSAWRLLKNIDFRYVVLSVKSEFTEAVFFRSALQELQNEFTQTSFIIATGGKNRHQSFISAWSALTKTCQHQKKDASCIGVAVHDANRPYLSQEFLQRIDEHLSVLCLQTPCFVPSVSAVDSLVQTDKYGNVLSYLKRDFVRHIQTPQLLYGDALLQKIKTSSAPLSNPQLVQTVDNAEQKFHPQPLEDAQTAQNHFAASADFGDEGSLMLRLGYRVKFFEGDRENIKITFAEDIKDLKNV